MLCCDICKGKVIATEVVGISGGKYHFCDHHKEEFLEALTYAQSIFVAKGPLPYERINKTRFRPTPRPETKDPRESGLMQRIGK